MRKQCISKGACLRKRTAEREFRCFGVWIRGSWPLGASSEPFGQTVEASEAGGNHHRSLSFGRLLNSGCQIIAFLRYPVR